MIDTVLHAALGFLTACLLSLIMAAPLWQRAVRLTTRRIEATLPMSMTDIQADKDQLRAQFAVELRKVEVALEKAKDKAARELVEANKRRVEIAALKEELETAKRRIAENANANRVLEQTIKRRLPDLEARIKASREAIAELEVAHSELRDTVSSQAAALKEGRNIVQSQRDEIESLRAALEGSGRPLRVGARSDPELTKENQRLNAEVSRLKEELARMAASAAESGQLRWELDTLADKLLMVAGVQPEPNAEPFATAARPYEIAAKPEDRAEPAMELDGTETAPPAEASASSGEAAEEEPELAAHAGINGGGNGIEAPAGEPAGRAEESVKRDSEPAETEAGIGQGRSLVERFAARRARRRASRNRPQSLTERLEGVVEEVPADADR
jgi:hypothetical protein